jgi:hypothetical protein
MISMEPTIAALTASWSCAGTGSLYLIVGRYNLAQETMREPRPRFCRSVQRQGIAPDALTSSNVSLGRTVHVKV